MANRDTSILRLVAPAPALDGIFRLVQSLGQHLISFHSIQQVVYVLSCKCYYIPESYAQQSHADRPNLKTATVIDTDTSERIATNVLVSTTSYICYSYAEYFSMNQKD